MADETKIVETSNAGEASTSRGKKVDAVIEIKDDAESDGPLYDAWAQSINEKCNGHERSEEHEIPKIPRVPQQHRRGDNEAYEPRIIPIGPYHRGNSRLQRMENQKLACMRQLNNRCSLADCLREIKAKEWQARSWYSDDIDLSSNDFVEMMLMDGCFIVFYLLAALKLNTQIRSYDERLGLEDQRWRRYDETLSEFLKYIQSWSSWMHDEIRNDLILLENQLPFFVVELIYSSVKRKDDPLLMDLAHLFCDQVSPINSKDLRNVRRPHPSLVHHLLHLYHWFLFSTIEDHHMTPLPNTSGMTVSSCSKCINSFLRCMYDWLSDFRNSDIRKWLSDFGYRQSSNSTTNSSHLQKSKCTIGSATFLEEAGIKFRKKKQVTDSIMDAEFTNGVMEITPLFIDVFTVSQFRNLIALEKSDHYLEPQVIAFARFMDYIISTSKDVALLRKKGIIQHAFGSDEEVATIFNQLTSGTLDYQTPKLTKMYEDVDEYCKSKCHQWRAILMRDYFGSPWAVISLVAAVILISLTFLQTYFSMYSYFRPP